MEWICFGSSRGYKFVMTMIMKVDLLKPGKCTEGFLLL